MALQGVRQKRSTIPFAALILLSLLLVSMFLTLGLSFPAFAFTAGGDSFSDSRLVNGLSTPTAMEFAPDGRLFVAEKAGALRVIKNGALLSNPFLSVAADTAGERGLLGIAFDPNFATNRYLYVYYTAESPSIHNRVSRFTADSTNPDRVLPGSELPILELGTLGATNHNAGAIHFGKDGKLYVAVGDNAVSSDSQSLSSRNGKMLRINSDGSIPSDNPFFNTSGARNEIWALGLRNPFTFAISPASTASSMLMNINDVGENSWEEVDRGISGANYGWPVCEGSCSNSNFVNPIYEYPHPTGEAITGGAFYEASQFPSGYKGSYFFGDYIAGFIKRLPAGSSQAVDFLTSAASPVDIKVGPDGSMYYLSINNGEVHKVQYVPSTGTSSLTIHSQDSAGSAISGYWTVLRNSAGAAVSSGFTPITFNLNNGQPYSVAVSNYGNYEFDHWLDNGSTANPRSLSISSSAQLTAIYRTVSGGSFPITHMADTTASWGSLTYSGRQVNAEYVSASSQLVGDKIDSITLQLKKTGSPTGTAQVGIFDSGLSLKQSFGTIDVSAISATSFQNHEFKLPSSTSLYTIQPGDRIGIKYTGGSSSNAVSIMIDRNLADPFDGTDSYRTRFESSWLVDTGEDITMTLKQTHS